MKDPREQIQTENLSAEQYCGEEGYGPARWSVDGECPVDWPELVELAQKILAANEAWLDGQTVTHVCECAFSDDTPAICSAYVSGVCGFCRTCGHDEACHTLAEIEPLPPPDEAALDAQRE